MVESIVIIGASDLQCPLIREAKLLGYETHVFAWAANDMGEKEADHFYPISIVEVDRILEVCRTIHPVAIASIASDLASITVTKIANALHLPGNPIETAIIATNKYEMRKTFANAGLHVPKFVKVKKEYDIHDLKDLRFPVIVKPTDRSGSRGIYKAETAEQLKEYIPLAQKESFEHAAIVEEYIEGKEYSCECISQNGVHHYLAITEKYTTGAPNYIEIGHIEPSGLDEQQCEKIKEQVFKALDALHIRNGASHSEFKITPDGEIRIIEIGARMGGDYIGSDLVRMTTGCDYVGMVLEVALGKTIRIGRNEQNQTAAAVRYMIKAEDYARYQYVKKNYPEAVVREYVPLAHPNQTVKDSSSRNGFYVVKAASREDAKKLTGLE